MKKFLISIIVILIIILIGQLIYFNFNDNSSDESEKLLYNSILEQGLYPEKQLGNNYGEETVIENIIQPQNIAELSQKYKGDMPLVTLEKELYKLIIVNMKEIYNNTNGTSTNKILQLYDLKKDVINNMNIYSKEDFYEMAMQSFNVGSHNYLHSNIDMNTYKENDNGYATFNMIFTYENGKQVTVKVYLANQIITIPSIKFGKKD